MDAETDMDPRIADLEARLFEATETARREGILRAEAEQKLAERGAAMTKAATAQARRPFDAVKFGEGIGAIVREELKRRLEPLAEMAERVKALEADNRSLRAELKAVGALRPLRYRGVWKAGASYDEGAFVTYRGSLWHADHDNPGTCGEPGSGWRLAVKRGRDGRRSNGDDRDDAGRD